MNGVKGLIYKELRLRRKMVCIAMLTWLLFFVLSISICLSMDFGNLANSESFPAAAESVLILSYALAATAMIVLINGGDTIYGDIKCHWDRFEYTLPISAKKIAAVKIFMLAAGALFSLGISLFSAWIIFMLSHRAFEFAVFKNITIIMLFFLAVAVGTTSLMLQYKNPQAVIARIFAGFMAIGVVMMILGYRRLNQMKEQLAAIDGDEIFDYLSGKIAEKYAGIRDMIFPFSALIFAAILLLGYFLLAGQLERREK